MTGAGGNAEPWLARATALSLLVMLACTVIAWVGADTGLASRRPVLTLALFSVFLVFDLIAISAGITLAALRRSALLSAGPALALVMTFVMLILAYDAWAAIRG